jgi:hypothetical protein
MHLIKVLYKIIFLFIFFFLYFTSYSLANSLSLPLNKELDKKNSTINSLPLAANKTSKTNTNNTSPNKTKTTLSNTAKKNTSKKKYTPKNNVTINTNYSFNTFNLSSNKTSKKNFISSSGLNIGYGFNIKNNLQVGLNLGYSTPLNKINYKFNNTDVELKGGSIYNTSFYAKYILLNTPKFNIFVNASAGYTYTSFNYKSTTATITRTNITNTTQVKPTNILGATIVDSNGKESVVKEGDFYFDEQSGKIIPNANVYQPIPFGIASAVEAISNDKNFIQYYDVGYSLFNLLENEILMVNIIDQNNPQIFIYNTLDKQISLFNLSNADTNSVSIAVKNILNKTDNINDAFDKIGLNLNTYTPNQKINKDTYFNNLNLSEESKNYYLKTTTPSQNLTTYYNTIANNLATHFNNTFSERCKSVYFTNVGLVEPACSVKDGWALDHMKNWMLNTKTFVDTALVEDSGLFSFNLNVGADKFFRLGATVNYTSSTLTNYEIKQKITNNSTPISNNSIDRIETIRSVNLDGGSRPITLDPLLEELLAIAPTSQLGEYYFYSEEFVEWYLEKTNYTIKDRILNNNSILEQINYSRTNKQIKFSTFNYQIGLGASFNFNAMWSVSFTSNFSGSLLSKSTINANNETISIQQKSVNLNLGLNYKF